MECTDGCLIDVFRFPEQVKEKLNQSERYRQIYWNYRWCLWQVHVQRCEMWNQPLSSYRPQGSEWYPVQGHYPEASGESDEEQSDNAPPFGVRSTWMARFWLYKTKKFVRKIGNRE